MELNREEFQRQILLFCCFSPFRVANKFQQQSLNWYFMANFTSEKFKQLQKGIIEYHIKSCFGPLITNSHPRESTCAHTYLHTHTHTHRFSLNVHPRQPDHCCPYTASKELANQPNSVFKRTHGKNFY